MMRKILTATFIPVRRVLVPPTYQRPTVHLYSRTSIMMMSTESEKPSAEGTAKPEPEQSDQLEADVEADMEADPVQALQASNEALEKQVNDMRDKMLRALANEENVRRNAKRDIENVRICANTEFAESLLEVSDNLEWALDAAASVAYEGDHEAFANLVEGVQMTQKQLAKVFESHGVVKYGAVGDVFDPNLHDALYRMLDRTKPEGTVGQLLKSGYKLHDRVIRAAEVGTVTHS
ncbi:Mge2 [Symbiodinium microadriaticum]|nr:Mge2 [Symbiodinium microadriaticum]